MKFPQNQCTCHVSPSYKIFLSTAPFLRGKAFSRKPSWRKEMVKKRTMSEQDDERKCLATWNGHSWGCRDMPLYSRVKKSPGSPESKWILAPILQQQKTSTWPLGIDLWISHNRSTAPSWHVDCQNNCFPPNIISPTVWGLHLKKCSFWAHWSIHQLLQLPSRLKPI